MCVFVYVHMYKHTCVMLTKAYPLDLELTGIYERPDVGTGDLQPSARAVCTETSFFTH